MTKSDASARRRACDDESLYTCRALADSAKARYEDPALSASRISVHTTSRQAGQPSSVRRRHASSHTMLRWACPPPDPTVVAKAPSLASGLGIESSAVTAKATPVGGITA
jgi:hypothetical protein